MPDRRSVIAALFASMGGFFNAANAQGPRAQLAVNGGFELWFQKGDVRDPYSLKGCKATTVTKEGNLSFMDCSGAPLLPEPQYALIVHYGDREVKLTANEIMDALEGTNAN